MFCSLGSSVVTMSALLIDSNSTLKETNLDGEPGGIKEGKGD